jgi:hypothetical protein
VHYDISPLSRVKFSNFKALAKTGTLKCENLERRNIVVHWQQEHLYI